MVKQKVFIEVFRYAESEYGLHFVQALFLHGVLATFQFKVTIQRYDGFCRFLPVLPKTPSFKVKLGSQILHCCIHVLALLSVSSE